MAFIDQNKDDVLDGRRLGVEPICRVLQVASSTYYAAKNRTPSARALRDAELIPQLVAIWEDNYRVYGVRKLWKAARRAGIVIGRDQTARLMRAAGIEGASRSKRVRTTLPDPAASRHPDLVRREFTATAPNRLWVTDLTFVPTWAGVAYVCFSIDAFSRMIVGWRVASHMRTEMVLDAIEMARWSRGHHHDDLRCHSDAGAQGEFNWSSQHLDEEVFDGSSSAGRGQGGSSEAPLAGASEVPEARRGGILGRDRERAPCGGSCGGCRRGARSRREMVPTRWRHGTVRYHPTVVWPLSLLHRA
ncbi:hypothetical protein GCM10010915_25210 [Microbacterium faecale]|uniref:Integrase catalytic domain-containing protein n=1 Tax=Microbacterium faecale TaxID=1804630 RepID=A0A916YFP2_9MICO|nr:hypothetical protein GCM10010915_25210 [Microbacterium faecale]